ncbi:MAG TPA: hypothetical protein VF988_06880, partial [Verrucomicrobiae bacterium]
MTEPNPASRASGQSWAIAALVCLLLVRVDAQSLSGASTNDWTGTNVPAAGPVAAPPLTSVALDTNSISPDRLKRLEFVQANARMEASMRDYLKAEQHYVQLL